MAGRKLQPDESLKHPRRFRKSPVRGDVLDIPEPSKKEKARWKPLVDLLTRAVLMNNHVDNIAKRVAVRLVMPTGWKASGDVPPEPSLTKPNKIWEVNAEIILLWLYKHKLAPFSPNMIYAGRRALCTQITKLENVLDVDALLWDNLELDDK